MVHHEKVYCMVKQNINLFFMFNINLFCNFNSIFSVFEICNIAEILVCAIKIWRAPLPKYGFRFFHQGAFPCPQIKSENNFRLFHSSCMCPHTCNFSHKNIESVHADLFYTFLWALLQNFNFLHKNKIFVIIYFSINNVKQGMSSWIFFSLLAFIRLSISQNYDFVTFQKV